MLRYTELDPRSERATSERLTSDPGVLSVLLSTDRVPPSLHPALLSTLLVLRSCPPCRAVYTPLYTCALSAVASFKQRASAPGPSTTSSSVTDPLGPRDEMIIIMITTARVRPGGKNCTESYNERERKRETQRPMTWQFRRFFFIGFILFY